MTDHALQIRANSEPADPAWMRPQTMHEALQFAEVWAKSDLVPAEHRGKPANVLVCMSVAQQHDIPLMAAFQGVAVINGKPTIWGDLALALCQRHPDFEDIEESIEGEGDDRTATCIVKRRGRTPTVRTFSVADAKRAKLWGKQGPWQQYPDRMLQMRSRGFSLRDAFADALKGFSIAEEARDMAPTEYRVVSAPSRGVAALEDRIATDARLAQVREKIQAVEDRFGAQASVHAEPESVDYKAKAVAAIKAAGINRDQMVAYVAGIVGREPSPDEPLTDDEWIRVAEAADEDAAKREEEVADA